MDLVLALEELGALDRQIVYLCDYLGWDQRRAAQRVRLREGALRMRLHRARERLGKMLESWHPRCVQEGGDG